MAPSWSACTRRIEVRGRERPPARPEIEARGVLDLCDGSATAYAVEHAPPPTFSILDEPYVIGDTIYSLQEPEPTRATDPQPSRIAPTWTTLLRRATSWHDRPK